MPISTMRRRTRAAMAVLLLPGAAFALTACGEQRVTDPVAAGSVPSPRPTAAGASPYVEPGAGDGAPHYRENNAYRLPGEMSPASAEDAREEADRIEPVLRRLWQAGTWDPESVRTALLGIGYEEERTGPKGERLGGTLTVRAMELRFENDHYVKPEGAQVGVRVHDDACVTAFVQKTNFEVKTNGPFPETGCFEPPAGH
ncbi:hypothetical protein ACIGEZ_29280 [Streptomyces sp. NPDC085481]|uniref:hypothetical protein n=1 Tax=Streptomyces sp. NPDC085481 TaxID=3365727 RepID=UPI0037D28BDB